ncbi:MAG TPA: amidase family protein [Polyangiaceae bacterium]|nr:amidase family protein [Polyangiaceae bacterium]
MTASLVGTEKKRKPETRGRTLLMALWQLSATELASLLARREVNAKDALFAHIERIDQVDGRVRAFTEVMRERAAVDAEQSDQRRHRGEARGPLDGLPVSVKECFDVAGRPTTLGLPSWRGRVAARDAALIDLLRAAGAVVVGRTNLSQTMLYHEARNPIFGQTANPWSLAHTPGGSSGGSAAAVAAGMCVLSVGTDLGGSVRVPCHFCGISGIKPSLDRLPMRGYRTVAPGQEAVRAMAGPMARTVDDLALFFRSLDPDKMSELDPRSVPLPWVDPQTVRVKELRVGVFVDDGVLPVSRSIARAVERAAEALRASGSEVRPFEPPDVRGVISAYLGALSSDGGVTALAALAGGEVDPVLKPLRRIAQLPAAARRIAVRVARAAGQTSVAWMLDAMGEKSVAELWDLTDRLAAHRAALLAAMDRQAVDVLLCPVFATPAFPHGGSRNFTLAASHSILFNALQLPAGVVPVTRVREAEAHRADASRDILVRSAAMADAQSAGLPVGVQVVGRPWKDHVVLAAMRAIERDVSATEAFPRTPVEVVGA